MFICNLEHLPRKLRPSGAAGRALTGLPDSSDTVDGRHDCSDLGPEECCEASDCDDEKVCTEDLCVGTNCVHNAVEG